MSSLLQTEWSLVKKEVNGAVSLDLAGGDDGPFLAYKTYLDCLLKILSHLRRDAATVLIPTAGVQWGIAVPPEVVTQRRNFVKLAKQCLDRVNDLADAAQPPDGGGGGGGMKKVINQPLDNPSTRHTTSNSTDLSLLLPDVPSDFPLGFPTPSQSNPTEPGSVAPGSASTAPSSGNSSSTTRSASDRTGRGNSPGPKKTSPSESQRRTVGGNLRHLPNVDLAQNQKATVNMATYRKMEEERKIAKKTQMRMEQRMKERKNKLEEDALERFADDSSSSGIVMDKARFFASAALIEQDDAVLALLRKKLATARQEGNAEDEAKFIDALMNKILIKMPKHPLTELVVRHQRSLINRLQPLITPYIKQLDSVIVPYVEPPPSLSAAAAASEVDTANGAAAVAALIDESKPPPKDNSEYVAELEKQSFERQKLDILESEAIERHLDAISQDVRMAVEVIMSKLSLLYGEEMFGEETDAASAARDRAYGMIEKIFFKPLWPLLVNMFRLGNKQDEVQLARIMTSNLDLSPEDVGIPPHLCLVSPSSSPSHPHLRRHGFEPVISELHHLATLSSPLCKLECLVNLCKTVCTCVDEIKRANAADDVATAASVAAAASPGSLGADDLLPILSFAILRSKMPQLASESRAMSEFIHESYQMGEEGYCLISIQTAIGYLMRLDEEG